MIYDTPDRPLSPPEGTREACVGCGFEPGTTRINGQFYCSDCTVACACGDPVVDGENGTVDEEGQARCCWCEAREIRQAHPEPPRTVVEYLRAKGEAA